MLHGRLDRKSNAAAANATAKDSMRSGSIRQTFGTTGADSSEPAVRSSIVRFDLVKERIAQAVGVGVPLPRPLVGRQRRRPHRIGAVAAVHREVESVADEQSRPLPPGAELT